MSKLLQEVYGLSDEEMQHIAALRVEAATMTDPVYTVHWIDGSMFDEVRSFPEVCERNDVPRTWDNGKCGEGWRQYADPVAALLDWRGE